MSLVLLSRQTILRKFDNICVRCAIMRIWWHRALCRTLCGRRSHSPLTIWKENTENRYRTKLKQPYLLSGEVMSTHLTLFHPFSRTNGSHSPLYVHARFAYIYISAQQTDSQIYIAKWFHQFCLWPTTTK